MLTYDPTFSSLPSLSIPDVRQDEENGEGVRCLEEQVRELQQGSDRHDPGGEEEKEELGEEEEAGEADK